MNVNLIIIIRNINQDNIVNIVKNEEKCKICSKHFVSSLPPPPPMCFSVKSIIINLSIQPFFHRIIICDDI